MSQLKLRVRCSCGYEQCTESVVEFTCFRCGKSNLIFPKKGKSRVVKIVKGSMELLTREIWRSKHVRRHRR